MQWDDQKSTCVYDCKEDVDEDKKIKQGAY